LKIPSYLSSYS